ncbi:sialin [Diorhabda sublineata]|uniref:sialin n=1 Tax=Diorhabda sublineata TaxID=1163346 RepID=UPI0024E15119|nr:sialin [Diorhabda sublineata]XP_056638288.1 sialin [Diorhabda sublineata]
MATATTRRRWSDFITCRQVLNIMVILGFMFNYMLRVNLTIAVVDMVIPTNATEETRMKLMEQNKFNWTTSQKNEVLGSFFWGYILTEIPGGRMAEIVGARKVFGGGMLLASLLTILTPVASTNFYVLVVLRALVGLALGATWPSMPPMAAKWIPPMERSKFMANMMASALGAALTLPVCGFLISLSGWECVFYVTGAVGIVWSILWFTLIYDSPSQHPRITEVEKYEIETKIAQMEGGGTKNVKPEKLPLKEILTCAPVWAIIVTHGCSVFCYFTVVNQLPTYMKDVLQFNIKNNGLLSSLPYFGKYLMAVLASYAADKLRKSGRMSTTVTRKVFTTFACSLPAIMMVIQALWGKTSAISVTVFTCALFFNGAVTAGYLSNVLDIAPNFSGTIFGMANTLSSIAGWVSTKVVAVITETESTFRTWRYIFWILAGAYAFATVVYLVFGTGKLQKFNSVDTTIQGKELQPLKTKYENGKEADIA